MKKLFFSGLLSILFLSTAFAQYRTERTGYEGDYFSLEGALDLFKQSRTLSDFERKLNTESNWVNNLDLNYDGRIDYIRVEHRREGNYHVIILQAVLDRRDIQDVAVIEIEVRGRREAVLQIIGDEDLYGEEVIVEPIEGYSDSRRAYNSNDNDYVNVYYWDPVQYILGQQYRVYVSPYRWQYYPTWWSPWNQCTWSVFRPRIVVYHRHYHIAPRLRVVVVHNFYRPYRSYSYNVVQRTNTVRVSHGKSPVYRPAPGVRQDRVPVDNRSRERVAERPNLTTRSSTPEQRPAVSRKNTSSSAPEQNATRSRATEVRQRSDSSVNRPETPRSTTPAPRPAMTNRKTSPTYDQPVNRGTAPATREPSRSTTTRSASAPRMSPAPAKTERRTAPANVPQQTRTQPTHTQPTRSSTTTRSTTPVRKPAASSSSSRSAPAAKSKASGSTSPKRSSTQSGSRSRSGGGL